MAMTVGEVAKSLAENKHNLKQLQAWAEDINSSKDSASIKLSKLQLIEEYISNHFPEGTEERITRVISFEESIAQKFIALTKSAYRRNKEFNLTLLDVRNLMRKKTCHYTKQKFEETGDNARTIDRIDNTKGYVKGNVVACTHWANQTKNALFERPDGIGIGKFKQLKQLIDKMETHL